MFAVYSAAPDNAALVLTPDCLAPSRQAEREFGPLRPCGAVCIDVDLLDSIAEHRNAHNLEFVVTEPMARHYVARLLDHAA